MLSPDILFLVIITLLSVCPIYKFFTIKILFQHRLGDDFYYIRVGLTHYKFTRYKYSAGIVYKPDRYDYRKTEPIADKKLADYLIELINNNFPAEGCCSPLDPYSVVSRQKRWLRKLY